MYILIYDGEKSEKKFWIVLYLLTDFDEISSSGGIYRNRNNNVKSKTKCMLANNELLSFQLISESK